MASTTRTRSNAAMADSVPDSLPADSSLSQSNESTLSSAGYEENAGKYDNIKDYTRVKHVHHQAAAEFIDLSQLLDTSLTDMLISSTPTKNTDDKFENFKLFQSFDFPGSIDLPEPHPGRHSSGSQLCNHEADGITIISIERQQVLEAQLLDVQNKLQTMFATNQSITAQNDLLNAEIEQYRKTIKDQKSQIKKVTNENDNLRCEISKCKGIRKYVQSDSDKNGDINNLMDKLNVAEAKFISFKQHVLDTANQLISSIEGDSSDNPCTPAQCAPAATALTAVRSVSAAAPCPQQRPTNDSDQPTQIMADQRSSAAEYPQVPQVIDSRVRTCMMRQPSTRPRQQPSVVLIGSSLVRDQGTKLRKEGVDCECYTIGGGTIPHIKSRIPHILNDRCQPKYVHLTCGGNDLSHKNVNNVCKDYDNLITEVKRCCPGAVVTINTLPPRRRDMRLNDKIQQLNDYIRSRASQGDGVRCHDDHPRFPDCFSNDRVHFNKAGKSVYARQLANYYVNFPPLFISEPR